MRLAMTAIGCIILGSVFVQTALGSSDEQAFHNLLHHVDRYYITNNKWDCATFVKNHPDAIAAMIGNAAFQQMSRAPSATEGRRRVNSLMTFAKGYFNSLAKAANYSTKGGKRVTGDSLFKDAVYYARGQGQDTIAKTMNVYPGQIPIVFNVDPISSRPRLLSLLSPKVPRVTKPNPRIASIRKTIQGEKPKNRIATLRAKTISKSSSSALPTTRICYVGQSTTNPPSFAVAIDDKKKKAVEKLTLSGHSRIVFGPATWDECWQWIDGQKDGPSKLPRFCVALDDYDKPLRYRVLEAANTKGAEILVKRLGFTDVVHGPASYRSCWEFIAKEWMKE